MKYIGFFLAIFSFSLLGKTHEFIKDEVKDISVLEVLNDLENSLNSEDEQRPIKGNLWTKLMVGEKILIPYEASNKMKHSAAMITLITAMDEFRRKTCVLFLTRDPNQHKDYIFFDIGRKCSTWIGRKGGKQLFLVGGKCLKKETLLGNMLMFTLGFGKPHQSEALIIETDDNFDEKAHLIQITEFEANYKTNSDGNEKSLSTIDVEIVNRAYRCRKTATTEQPPFMNQTCGKPSPKSTSSFLLKIVGGSEVKPGSIPWQVSINMRSTGISFCGGSLINKYWIISAAHCFKYTINPSYYTGYLGKHHKYKYDDTERQVFFSLIIKHEGYDSKSKADDIALLKLEKAVTFTDYIKPICLPAHGLDVPDFGSTLTVSGWGDTQGTGDNSVLLKTQVYLIMWLTCKRNEPTVLENMLCAGHPRGGKDSCTGDSGGPLTYKQDGTYKLVGIVSWGRECGKVDHPGIYTNVALYLDWINEKMKL